MLRYMLDSHPDIICHGEILANSQLEGLSKHWDANLVSTQELKRLKFLKGSQFLSIILSSKTDKIVGLKFKTDEFFLEQYQVYANELKNDLDISIIHLKRKNILAQYISHQRILKRHAPMANIGDKRKVLHRLMSNWRDRPIYIAKDKFVRYAENILNRDEKIDEIFENHRKHEIWYEDLVHHQSKTLEVLFEFLKVKSASLYTPTKKQVESHHKMIKNPTIISQLCTQTKFQGRVW